MANTFRNFGFQQALLFSFFSFTATTFLAAQEQWMATGCTPDDPSVTQIQINACGNENTSEFVTIQSGNAPFNVNATPPQIDVECPEGVVNAAVTTWTGNAAVVNSLNAAVGACGTGNVFINAMAAPVSGVIPPNSVVMAFVAASPDVSYLMPGSLAALCGGSPIYVIFGNSPATTPLFKNSVCSGCGCFRYIDVDIGGCHYDIDYDVDNMGVCTEPCGGPDIQAGAGNTVVYGNNTQCIPTTIFCTPPAAPAITNSPLSICNGATSWPGTFNCSNCDGNTVWFSSETGNTAIFTGATFPDASTPVPTTNTTYWVANVDGCSSDRVPVNVVLSTPPSVNAVTSISRCAGQTASINFSGTAGATFSWENDNTEIGLGASGTGNITAFTTTAPNGVQEIATITVTPSVNGCEGTPRTFTITVNPTPTVMDPPNIVVCEGDPIEVIFDGSIAGATYSWVNNNTAIGVPANGTNDILQTANNPGNTPITGTITVTPSLGGCPGSSQSFTVTVGPQTTMNPIADIDECSGMPLSVTFSGPFGNSYSWTNDNTDIGLGASGTGNIPNFTTTTPNGVTEFATITVTPYIAGCPGILQTFNITITPGPTMNDPANLTLCEGDPINVVFSSGTPGLTYSWTNNNTGIGVPAAGNGHINQVANNPGSTNITGTITVTPSNGVCPGTPQTFTVTVRPQPSMNPVADVSSCAGNPISIAFSGSGGTTYTWTNNNTSIGLGANGTGNPPTFNGQVSNGAITTATLTVTPSNGACPGAPEDAIITVYPTPVLTIGAVTCAPDLATYSVAFTNSAGSTVTSSAGTVFGSSVINIPVAVTSVTLTATLTANNTCTATATVTAPNCSCPPIAAPTGANAAYCQGSPIPALTASAAGLQINWYAAPTGGTAVATNSATFTPTGPGTYYAESFDPATNCTSTTRTAIVLTQHPLPAANITGDLTVCAGTAVQLTASGGTVFNWSNSGGSSANATFNGILVNTSFTVTVTDANNCSATATADVVITPMPTLTIGAVTCSSDLTTYSVAFTATGGTVTSNAGTLSGNSFINIPAATASVTLTVTGTANTDCVVSVPVTAPNCNCPPIAAPTGANAAYCQGSPIPALTASAAAGLQINWYAAPTGGTAVATNSATFTPTGPGTYYAESFDPATNCTSTTRTAIVLTQHPLPAANITGDLTVCAGTAVQLTASGGTVFNWSNSGGSSANATFNGILVNTSFTVTVTDANNCSATATADVVITPMPTLTIGAVTCSSDLTTYSVAFTATGGTVTSNAGTLSGNSVINIPATTASVTLTVTGTANTDCVVSVPVTAPNCNCPPIAAPTGANAAYCQGSPIPALTASAAAGLQINWYAAPTGGTAVATNSATFTPTGPGTYYAESFDPATNCTSTTRTAIVLTQHPLPAANITGDLTVCAGTAVQLTASGGTVFNWSNSGGSSANATFNGILVNTSFTVTVTDANNCSATATADVVITPMPTLTIGAVTCSSDLTTYSVAFTATGGTVTSNAGTLSGNSVINIPAATASVTLTVTGTANTDCVVSVPVTAPNCNCPPIAAPTGANAAYCQGSPIPALTASAAAGLQINWYAAPTGGTAVTTNSASFMPTGPGTYYAESFDPATNCTGTTRTAIVLTQYPLPTANITGDLTVCAGTAVQLTASGGTTFNWSNSGGSSANATFNGILVNTSFTVTVTDANNCSATATADVVIAPMPTLTIGAITCSPDLIAFSVEVTYSGGVLSSNFGTINGNIISNIPVAAGSVQIRVTSASNTDCQTTAVVNAPVCSCPPIAPPTGNSVTFCQGSAPLPITVSAGTGLQINWYSQPTGGVLLATNTATFTPPAAGTYYAEAIDIISGCTSGTRTALMATTIPAPVASVTGNNAICVGEQSIFSAAPTGATYQWSTGATTATITLSPLLTTTYSVIVTNAAMCSDTAYRTLTVHIPYLVTIVRQTCDPSEVGSVIQMLTTIHGCDSIVTTNTQLDLSPACAPDVVVSTANVSCHGAADGHISLEISGDFPPFDYQWDSGSSNGNGQQAAPGAILIEDLVAGTYHITVTGSNGASLTLTATVTQPPTFQVNIQVPQRDNGFALACNGDSDATATAGASGGTAPYQYQWDNGVTTSTVTGLAAGIITLTVTDAQGCTAAQQAQVSAPAAMALTLTATPPPCNTTTQTFTATPSGGSAPYTLLLNGDTQTGLSAQVPEGTHQLSVTDSEGCRKDTSIMVDLPDLVILALPADTVISFGAEMHLEAQTNLTNWDTLVWHPLQDTSHANNLLQVWTPLTSQIVAATITDSRGCTATDQMRITVRRDIDIYVPNVFHSGQGDGNDFWRAFSDRSVREVQQVHVFDRWGDEVYVWDQPAPLSAWPGWDGRLGGRQCPPGVYVYYIKVLLIDNSEVLLKGDVTIVR